MDNNCDWICDYCGAYMNDQPGFDVTGGTWTCTECGAVNDVSENNVLDLLGCYLRVLQNSGRNPQQNLTMTMINLCFTFAVLQS